MDFLQNIAINFKSKHFRSIGANGWVYEKVCLYKLSNYHTVNSKLSYTPCYNQYGNLR